MVASNSGNCSATPGERNGGGQPRAHIHAVREVERAGDDIADRRCVGVRHLAPDQIDAGRHQLRREGHAAALFGAVERAAPDDRRLGVGVDLHLGQRHLQFRRIVGHDHLRGRIEDVLHIREAVDRFRLRGKVSDGAGDERDLAVDRDALRDLGRAEIHRDHQRQHHREFHRGDTALVAADPEESLQQAASLRVTSLHAASLHRTIFGHWRSALVGLVAKHHGRGQQAVVADIREVEPQQRHIDWPLIEQAHHDDVAWPAGTVVVGRRERAVLDGIGRVDLRKRRERLHVDGEAVLTIKQGVDPVSYTHLDVYKRQAVGLALGPSIHNNRVRRAHHLDDLLHQHLACPVEHDEVGAAVAPGSNDHQTAGLQRRVGDERIANDDGGDVGRQLDHGRLIEADDHARGWKARVRRPGHGNVRGRRLAWCDHGHCAARQNQRQHETPQHQRHPNSPAPYASTGQTRRPNRLLPAEETRAVEAKLVNEAQMGRCSGHASSREAPAAPPADRHHAFGNPQA